MTRPDGSLTAAFGTLNELGYIAREDFACCGTCAGYELTMLAEEAIDRGRPAESIRGAVFYHRQDAERFALGEDFHLGYGQLHSRKYGRSGSPDRAGRPGGSRGARQARRRDRVGRGRPPAHKVLVSTISDPWPALDDLDDDW